MNDSFLSQWTMVYNRYQVDLAIHEMASYIICNGDTNAPLVLVTILKGGLWTAYHLLYKIVESGHFEDIRIGHMGLSSYGDQRVPREMKVTYTLDLDIQDIQGQNVWLIDDIWHRGTTLQKGRERLLMMNPRSVRTGVLVRRDQASEYSSPNISGFVFGGQQFLCGCGMGAGEKYRHLPEIYAENNVSCD